MKTKVTKTKINREFYTFARTENCIWCPNFHLGKLIISPLSPNDVLLKYFENLLKIFFRIQTPPFSIQTFVTTAVGLYGDDYHWYEQKNQTKIIYVLIMDPDNKGSSFWFNASKGSLGT